MVVLTSLPPPTEGIRHKQGSTQAHIKGRTAKCLGTGELFVAESRLSWTSTEGKGFSLEYPAIALHAISKDMSAFPQECIYVMLDADLEEEANNSDNSSSSNESNAITEIRFVPEDKGTLEAIYGAMCECQALHPDEQQDSFSEGDDDYYEGEEGAGELTAEGQATLERLDGVLQTDNDDQIIDDEPQIGNRANGNRDNTAMDADEPMETGQFEDADM